MTTPVRTFESLRLYPSFGDEDGVTFRLSGCSSFGLANLTQAAVRGFPSRAHPAPPPGRNGRT